MGEEKAKNNHCCSDCNNAMYVVEVKRRPYMKIISGEDMQGIAIMPLIFWNWEEKVILIAWLYWGVIIGY